MIEEILVAVEIGAFMPMSAHAADAGYDMRTPKSVLMFPFMSRVIDTGVHMQIPEGYVGFIKSKSGLNVKHNITSEGGVIDSGYTGSIKVKLRNHGFKFFKFNAGDKITQIVLLPIAKPDMLWATMQELEETERGDAGFGSTGK